MGIRVSFVEKLGAKPHAPSRFASQQPQSPCNIRQLHPGLYHHQLPSFRPLCDAACGSRRLHHTRYSLEKFELGRVVYHGDLLRRTGDAQIH